MPVTNSQVHATIHSGRLSAKLLQIFIQRATIWIQLLLLFFLLCYLFLFIFYFELYKSESVWEVFIFLFSSSYWCISFTWCCILVLQQIIILQHFRMFPASLCGMQIKPHMMRALFLWGCCSLFPVVVSRLFPVLGRGWFPHHSTSPLLQSPFRFHSCHLALRLEQSLPNSFSFLKAQRNFFLFSNLQ